MHTTSNEDSGIYDKYRVIRRDGSGRKGKKHHGCRYFVLDLSHDPNAIPALEAYAKACRKDFPKLADDLTALAKKQAFANRLRATT